MPARVGRRAKPRARKFTPKFAQSWLHHRRGRNGVRDGQACVAAAGRSGPPDGAVPDWRRKKLCRWRETDERSRALPSGYDSIYLSGQSSSPGVAPNGSSDYHHEYVLFNAAQVLPMYLVQFFMGPAEKADGGAAPGRGTSLSPGIQELYDRYDFFDPILYVPVSVRDKMVGSHSTGEAAQHKLIGIGDAYEMAIKESKKGDPLLQARQAEIRNQLQAVDQKLRDVNKNSAEIEERIYQMLQDALFDLQDKTQAKMNVLLAEEVELRRQLGYIDWVENFLNKETARASQVNFLNMWKCHAQLRGDLAKGRLRTQEAISGVRADLSLSGGLSVLESGSGQVGSPAQLTGVAHALPAVMAEAPPAVRLRLPQTLCQRCRM